VNPWAAVTVAAVTARFLASALQGSRGPVPPLSQRTRTPPGLPRDGAPLGWQDTLTWNDIVRQYGPGEPAWPGGRQKGAGH